MLAGLMILAPSLRHVSIVVVKIHVLFSVRVVEMPYGKFYNMIA